MRRSRTLLTLSVGIMFAALLGGCAQPQEPVTQQTIVNRKDCGGAECHDEAVAAQAAGAHSGLECTACHEGTGQDHADNPKETMAATDWTIDGCAGCHADEAATYLYDDNAQPGPFGGSQRKPPQPKADTFPEYKTIVAGHPFTRDYNEEGAHVYMLEDHYETLRGKFETCVQCKSTKVAVAWDSGRPLTVAKDTEITLTHTATEGVPPKKVTIPKGTRITYATEPSEARVDAKAVFPDGTVWTSQPQKSQDATQHYNMVWASTIAAIKETFPYGAGCNHCHDPHTGQGRLVRKAMLHAIEDDGGPTGEGGVNPYQKDSPKDWTMAQKRDRIDLMCAQCHVEYVCGKSGVDGVDRDRFGWAKATDLHDVYAQRFGYAQDWKNAVMGEPLIKSQHPEMELYWESVHYDAGASCADCHMPEVRTSDNRTIRSHWFTSPYKYVNPELRERFADRTGVVVSKGTNPCVRCHGDRSALAMQRQRRFYQAQARVEKLLAESVRAYGAAKADPKVDSALLADALDSHRRAHVIWENLAVSENSMGFHNYQEAMESMAQAEKYVRAALEKERLAVRK